MPSLVSICLLQMELCINLSHDPTRPLCLVVIHIYRWELLSVCHHPERFHDHRHQVGKCFIKNMNLIDMYYHWKMQLIGQSLSEKKMPQSQDCTFWEKVPQYQKIISFPFYNFLRKIGAKWAKKFVKHILETWNANDVTAYFWLFHSRIK